MATINLGSIKFKWQGAYNGATAYTVDDVVSYNGSSYICILASTGNLPTNATYWEQMSSAGTNGTDGTDLGTTLTTQGDIVYRDASGLARLGAGTAGQALITNGTGANPSWGDVGGGIVQMINTTSNSSSSTTNTSFADTVFTITITPTSSSNKILIQAQGSMQVNAGRGFLTLERSGYGDLHGDISSTDGIVAYEGASSRNGFIFFNYLDSPASTSALTYKIRMKNSGANATYLGGNVALIMQAIELDGGIF